MEKEKLPKWPEELPLPVEWGKPTTVHKLLPVYFETEDDVRKLVHDMYWFSDDIFYIFSEGTVGVGEFLGEYFKKYGIDCGPIERCCYRHPNPHGEADFVHLPPDKIRYDWHKEATLTTEFTRYTLSLASWSRKNMDLSYAAQANAEAMEKPAPVVSAKPGIFGFSVDLISLYKRWFKK